MRVFISTAASRVVLADKVTTRVICHRPKRHKAVWYDHSLSSLPGYQTDLLYVLDILSSMRSRVPEFRESCQNIEHAQHNPRLESAKLAA